MQGFPTFWSFQTISDCKYVPENHQPKHMANITTTNNNNIMRNTGLWHSILFFWLCITTCHYESKFFVVRVILLHQALWCFYWLRDVSHIISKPICVTESKRVLASSSKTHLSVRFANATFHCKYALFFFLFLIWTLTALLDI